MKDSFAVQPRQVSKTTPPSGAVSAWNSRTKDCGEFRERLH